MSTLDKMLELRKQIQVDEEEQKKENMRATLMKTVETNIKTAFIGAISSFENTFGYLWGHGEMKLTEKQQQFRELWAQVRKEVFDKGNDQIKLAKRELSRYEVERTTCVLEVKPIEFFVKE